jgi:peptidoglycan/xylan/chitin deacetylase (PgdA/CDA1 family)
VESRRIAIVYSQTSADQFYDEFIFNQLFATTQQLARQAGLPYDLLTESEVTDATLLSGYDAVILPGFGYAPAATRDAMITALVTAQENGTGIISSGDLMALDENGQSFADWDRAPRQLLGLAPERYIEGEATVINIASVDHPITSGYAPSEEIRRFSQAWYAHYQPIDESSHKVLATATSGGQTYNAVIATSNVARAVQFANEELLADNLLWPALQWVIYGGRAPVALQLSRSDSIALARNDMDQTMFPALLDTTHVPLLEILKEWKRDYNFTGSHYIDIGNDPANGQYTDWSVSAPLMQQYIDLGIEIGTHSWTHPYFTALLSDEELEFEFNQAKNEISTQLNYAVTGGAIPGNTESLRVVDNLNQWFEYFSGKSNPFELTQPAAVGRLKPSHDLIYFSLNTSPDFTLADYLNYPPDVAEQVWREEIDEILSPHAQQPLIHWLWHDYAPTTETASGTYSREMFDNTVAYMHQRGAEFVTLDDMQRRIRNFTATEITVGASNSVEASVTGTGLGQFSLQLDNDRQIRNVENWYAYSDTRVFIPESGGQFRIFSGTAPDPVTRISKLPMRARLISVAGDGTALNFDFSGAGQVAVTLNPALNDNYVVSGADSIIEDGSQLLLTFNTDAVHSVTVDYNTAPNAAPVALDQAVATTLGNALGIVLSATDADNQSLEYRVLNGPQNGSLSGTLPNIVYSPNDNFSGQDNFTFLASDGIADSNTATVSILVGTAPIPDLPPVANSLVLQTLSDSAIAFVLSGSDNENQPLSYSLTTSPGNGTIDGVAPELVYTPSPNFTGSDVFSYVANDGTSSSQTATVRINVVDQLPPANGTRSNSFADRILSLDGELADWNGATSFGVDADDANDPGDLVDWRELWLGHDNDNLYLAYQTYDSSSLSWGHGVYLDVDTNTQTGFRGFTSELTIGADYLLEGGFLYRYAADGNGTSWSWVFVSQVDSASNADTHEFSVPMADLGNPVNLRLVLRGNSVATGGSSLDSYPDDAANPLAVDAQRHFSYSINANTQLENIAPDANPQRLELVSNTAVPILLSGTDLNSDNLDYTIETGPANGTLSGSGPMVVYTPATDFTGTDRFRFSVNDGRLQSNVAEVLLEVVAPQFENIAPVANSQTLAMTNTDSLPITLDGSDANGDALLFEVLNGPQNGSLSGSVPTLVYTPDAAFTGIDTLVFRASDGTRDSEPATISITVDSVVQNSAPVANSASAVTAFQTAIAVELVVSDADNQPLTYRIVDQPRLGSLSGNAPALTYTPYNGASGIDSFTFTASDGEAESNIATINIEILPEVSDNLPPVAIGLNLATTTDQSLALVLAGRDPEGAELDYQILSHPRRGSLSGTPPNLTYTPAGDNVGLDSFSYLVGDGIAQSDPAVVTIDITTQNSNTLSNPVSVLTVDGDLQDWQGLRGAGIDADDISGPDNPLDIRAAWLAHSADSLYLAARNDGPFMLSWGSQWLLDTDSDSVTGFRGFSGEYALGVDYLIEGASIHRYTGSGNDWSWSYQGSADASAVGDSLELAVPRALLGNPLQIQLFMIANNAAFGGSGVDYFPQAALDRGQPQSLRAFEYSMASPESETTASYRATFNSTWSALTHPTNFPAADPHFSGLSGVVHNQQLVLWETGELASEGIRQVAETGGNSTLLADVQSAIAAGSALAEISGGGIGVSPGSVSVTFDVDRQFPLVTLVSMLAPSPDWFIGVNGQSLLDDNGEFVDELSVDLRLYDSGTDSGERFFSADVPTNPPAPIALLTSNSSDTDFVDGLPVIGQLVFERINQ